MSEFVDSCIAIIFVMSGVTGGLALVAWLFERKREPEVLPPPEDGRDHNHETIAEWQRKRVLIDRTE